MRFRLKSGGNITDVGAHFVSGDHGFHGLAEDAAKITAYCIKHLTGWHLSAVGSLTLAPVILDELPELLALRGLQLLHYLIAVCFQHLLFTFTLG
jgi:hypothetical protein